MRPPLATAPATAATDDGETPSASWPASANHHLLFKKHKVLPHPSKDTSYTSLRGVPRPLGPPKISGPALAISAASSSAGGLSDDASVTYSQPSSPRTKKQYPKTLGNGPDLPPTPPAHSRNSSATYSVLPSTATYVQSPERSAEDVQLKPALPTTPTKQLSPPTPDVTPPHTIQPELRPKGPPSRPPLRDRNMSRSTADSRTASFKTARENPSSSSSDNEDSFTSLPPAPISARTSESTVRHFVAENHETPKKRQPKAVGLGLGLESSPEESITPKSKREFVSFDGEWGSKTDDAVKEWDDNLERHVAVRHPRAANQNAAGPGIRDEVIEDVIVTPTNATKALRSISLPQRILTFPSSNESTDQLRTQPQKPVQHREPPPLPPQQQQPQRQQQRHQRSQSQQLPQAVEQSREQPVIAQMAPTLAPSTRDRRPRVSTASFTSNVPAVAESVFFGSPPQRQRTLRHVKKQVTLRDSGLDLSPASSTATSLLDETTRQRRPNGGRFNSSGHDSIASTTSMNSISSRSARREIWKAGGIPVVVVPSRLSSVRSSSREPFLRSTSSRRSTRSQSLHSAPLSQISKSREVSPYLEQGSRRSRAYSVSEGSTRNSFARDGSAPGDQRTIDFPPTIPKRSSSLSAPTSRNVSRSGSLNAESVHAHSAILKARLNDQAKASPGTEPNDTGDSPAVGLAQQQSERSLEPASRPEIKYEAPAIPEAQRSESLLLRDTHMEQSAADETVLPRLGDHTDRHEDVQKRDSDKIHGDESNYDHRNLLDPRSSLDRYMDRYSSRHLSPHNTPFSMVSVETNTTHHSQAELSEALAVNIYPHQNTSVLVVDHSNRPSDCSDDSQPDRLTDDTGPSSSKQESSPASDFASALTPSSVSAPPLDRPRITKTDHDTAEDIPVTPSHQQPFSLDDVDSPLRNPRAPPEPPAINFIPATPSGLTPSTEREQNRGNYFEEVVQGASDGRPRRRRSVSLVLRKALSRGRSATTEYGPSASRSGGLLTRTLSLTRDVQRKAFSIRRSDSIDQGRGTSFDIEPAEEDKLHPFWRPASQLLDDDDYRHGNGYEDEETYRYPPIDNRPRGPRRSLSMRMKKTFAILPIDAADDFYPASIDDTPADRRTVRRTPSGNLRVVKHHGSTESLGEYATVDDHRPYTAPGRQGSRKFRFWRSPSLGRRDRPELHDNYYNQSTGADASNAVHEDEKPGSPGASGADGAAGGDRKPMKILPDLGLGDKIGEYGPHTIPRRFSERRREKRSNELRQKISGPQEVRDGVGEVIRRTNYRDAFTQAQAS
ncbi:uncharacterized protein SPSK_03892 [Sporothrix schenckii 1099-18]|uniref:Uncharacterized protein n=1 Tax=Sporothrix schenckii 1099-18 TaxID=1397361 RepID=A0A0F2M0J9_SPOSC|nr:uncharacterized protein SPSK_03892 [Sporothrix schenckii 1099-18]KJR83227.1 hypothetical protein SPSK_03892 [Sporothrix schenckii 1099-18]